MKATALIILVACILSIFAPFRINVPVCAADQGSSLLTLNVCHADETAISTSGNMPCLPELPCLLLLCEDIVKYSPDHFTFNRFLMTFFKERPPRS